MKTKLTYLLATIMGFLFIACSNDNDNYPKLGGKYYPIEVEAEGISLTTSQDKFEVTGVIPAGGCEFTLKTVGEEKRTPN